MITTGFPRDSHDTVFGKPILELSKRLAKSNKIEVLAPHDSGIPLYSRFENIDILRFRYFFPVSLQKLCYGKGGIVANMKRSLWAWLNLPFFILSFIFSTLRLSKNADIIHAHWIISGIPGLIAKFIYRKPLVITVRNTQFKDYPPFLVPFILKHSDWIISPHPELSDKLKQMGIEHFSQIPNPVNFSSFRYKSHSDKISAKLELGSGNKFIVLFTARFDDWKDPLTFVESIPYVLEKIHDIKFVMLGDGVLMNRVKKTITDLNLSSYVECKGFSEHVSRYIAAADLFTGISKVENIWSNTIIEAILSGVPCILSKAGYTENIFRDGQNAVLVNIEDKIDLAEGIIRLLNDQELRNIISKNAYDLLQNHGFNENSILDKTTEIYNKIRQI